jgi:hypothetical protein
MPRSAEAVPVIRQRVARGTTVHADEASGWDGYEMRRINHRRAYSIAMAPAPIRRATCTNISVRRGSFSLATNHK